MHFIISSQVGKRARYHTEQKDHHGHYKEITFTSCWQEATAVSRLDSQMCIEQHRKDFCLQNHQWQKYSELRD